MADLEEESVRFCSASVPVRAEASNRVAGKQWLRSLRRLPLMRRALFLASFTALLAGEVCFAQTKKASNNSKPSARQELSPPLVAGPGATAVPSHPNPYNVYGAQYPRIEEDNRVTFHTSELQSLRHL